MTPNLSDHDWMVPLLDSDQNAGTGRLGYDYRLIHNRPTPGLASIERWNGSAWESAGTAKLEVGTKALHLAAERAIFNMAIGKPLRFDFKWTDNVPAGAEGMDFLDQGDTAPNARLSYSDVAAPVQGQRPGD